MLFRATRKDWVLAYADVDTNAKQALSEVISARVAMHAISYDTKNYINKTEWLNKMNFLDNIVQEGVKSLGEQETKDAIA